MIEDNKEKMMDEQAIILKTLERILENQIKIKEELGIIQIQDEYCDEEYAKDLNYLNMLRA